MSDYSRVEALTFDLFGTVLDLAGSLVPPISRFLEAKGVEMPADEFWRQWRARQRIEQYQDTIMMLGHSGYLETVRRSFMYTLAANGIEITDEEVYHFLLVWQELDPFPEVRPALERLSERYRLVALSNGDQVFLDHLVANRIHFDFDDVISVAHFGAFKPHPAVYRGAARRLGLELDQCMMISANSFDIVGARACGFRAGYVDRYGLPYEDSPYRPDVTVSDFGELADALLAQ